MFRKEVTSVHRQHEVEANAETTETPFSTCSDRSSARNLSGHSMRSGHIVRFLTRVRNVRPDVIDFGTFVVEIGRAVVGRWSVIATAVVSAVC